MNLSQNNFSQGDALFRGADGRIRAAKVYSYETRDKLFDVYLIEGRKFVRVNCGPLSCFIDKWTPIHYAIESHFGLDS